MAYQALYRVWRSQRFEDVVGQRAITQTLKNAIIQNKTSHAYLFTGPRGTGKTSAAKIFAKAINCPNSQDGEPCNECEMCLSITEGRQEDVIEIDAASNNGVEEIRFIRDRANYAPTQATYKVYIIDEVHMLSTGAFNALLKTLEEPKEQVIFILATTEPHKIPLTIISRTQRFDFKRIGISDIANHLAHILKEIQLPYEEAALQVIARAAEGGMRDALSILDQAISYSEGTITLENAMQVTGSLTNEMMDSYLQHCFQGEPEAALENLAEILAEGKEARRFLEDMLLHCRDLLMYQQAPKLLAEKVGYLTETFKELAEKIPADLLYEWIRLLNETQNEVRFTNNANIYLEVATVKLATQGPKQKLAVVSNNQGTESIPARTNDSQELQALKQEVQQLQQAIQQLQSGQPQQNQAAPVKAEKQNTGYVGPRVPKEQVFQVLQEATKDHLQQVRQVWMDLLQTLSVTQRAMLKATEPLASGPNRLLIAFDYGIVCQKVMNDAPLILALQNNLSKMIPDYAPTILCIAKDAWPEVRQAYVAFAKQQPQEIAELENEELTEETQTVNVVTEAQKIFGDLVTVVDD
ncbi:DNA polymerase-3 subunit gamma/tau [Enterococcus sp. PF1-24]|uniref:DNA polymerase III subunit gamma/tau n=1 Tax=unclassified Enterococcus TaxID=2608891 RepID=UPI0024759598|nr:MULTISPECIES: DNA polymerase III subunit gamma/tau [unclassified Enterococcus]MDH6364778.1 DNA polymerase-3 subunit gamma/tau [Enterococcus sp. PFB1-1]MDH6401877.1 DNA polymerase-3 subunit gamma/tau [Enterococcus sp. PF1-24]